MQNVVTPSKSCGLKSQNLHTYLKSLSPATLDTLYSHPASCLAIFRELPVVARHYVMRLLFVEQAVPQAVVQSWIDQHHVKKHLEVIEALTELHIWVESSVPGGLPGWLLSSTFRKNLKIALLGGGEQWAVYAPIEREKHSRDQTFLDTYAMERWECILHFMVGSQITNEGISADAVRVLVHANLMKSEGDEAPVITTDGFQFLLMDTSSQVWYFMLQYLDTLESRNLSLVECLTFLFQLSFLQLGKGYSTEGMSESMLIFVQHLREIGLLYQRKRRSGRFYPTGLAINLTSHLKNSTLDAHRQGYIVVETNYRIYAYTDSQLQIALLALFSELMYRFPNVVVAVITRDSVRQALRSGITAQQIINFLEMHCHDEMQTGQTPGVPPVVIDQIRLWEIERDRFTFTEGVLYSQFLSQNDFEVLRNYARDLSVLVWDNSAKRVMVVSRSGHDDVKRFWKRHKQ